MAKRVTGNKKTNFNTSANKKTNPRVTIKRNKNKKKNNVVPKVSPNKKRFPTDARVKLIQKKKTAVSDAREVLAKIAKRQDARNKLNKLRQGQAGGMPAAGNVKVIGHSILQKTDRDGNITLVTNKAKPTTGISTAIRKELGLMTSPIHQKKAMNKARSPIRLSVSGAGAAAPPGGGRLAAQSLRQSVLNGMDYTAGAYGPPGAAGPRGYDPGLYKWTKVAPSHSHGPPRAAASQLIGSLESRSRAGSQGDMFAGWPNYTISKSATAAAPSAAGPLRIPRGYVDLDAMLAAQEEEDEEMPLVGSHHHLHQQQTISLQGSSRISNVHSRLDGINSANSNNVIIEPETHGILATSSSAHAHHQTTRTKVVVPAGHRIVVSNLQATVTQDDVKELFEDIGQLLAARLVRPGVAEVIYKNLKDAQKAVDTYHNRQLDGQPMKCLLVNKRPLNNPTAPPLTKLASEGIITRELSPSGTSTKLVPDLSTIHKVLFQRK